MAKENILKRIWKKTIFPEMIEKKKKEKQWKSEMQEKAIKAAQPEIEKILINKYKQEAINKMTGEKKQNNIMEKLAKGFDVGNPENKSDKVINMMGMGRGTTDINDKIGAMVGFGSIAQEPIKKEKTKKKDDIKIVQKEKSAFDVEDKIKRMLG